MSSQRKHKWPSWNDVMREEHESRPYNSVTHHQRLNYSENSSKGRLNPASREHPRRRQINGCTIKDLFVYKLEEIKTIFQASGPAQSGRKLRPIDRAVPHSRQVSAKVRRSLTIDPYANQFHNASGRTRGGIRWFNSATGGRFTYRIAAAGCQS